MIKIIILIGVGLLSWFIGLFGFAQIIGSIQNIGNRKWYLTVWTITLWTVILIGCFFLVKHYLDSNLISLYIGYGISLI